MNTEDKIDEILKGQEECKQFLKRLETAVLGDKPAGVTGLAKRVHEAERYIEADKKFKARAAGGLGVVGVLWGLIIKFWDKIFN